MFCHELEELVISDFEIMSYRNNEYRNNAVQK